MQVPAELRPNSNTPITNFDHNQMAWSSVTTCTVMKGRANAKRILEAFRNVVHKNPLLAGRLVDVGEDGELRVEITLSDATLGCCFEEVELSSEHEATAQRVTADAHAVVAHAVELKDLFRALQLPEPGSGFDQLQKNLPLAFCTVYQGQELSLLCLSVSHIIGDGFTYYELLKALDNEYSKPGSSKPLQGRDTVDAGIASIMSTYTAEEKHAQSEFFPRMYMENIKNRDLAKCHEVRLMLPVHVLEAMKAAVTQKHPQQIISKQDVLSSWIASQVGAEFVSYVVNIRGRSPVVAPRSMSNAEMIWYAKASGSKDDGDDVEGPFKAADMRASIKTCGAHTQFTLAAGSKCAKHPAAVIGTNSWIKVQHLPRFGGQAGIHVPVYTWESLPVVFRTVSNLLYAVNETDYVLHQWGLDCAQADKLEKAWRSLGVETITRLTGTTVLQRTARVTTD